ncbi:cathelicidin-2-like [Sceloporus undulatus]|uniref:cathelicidin-2-like n=1 Tax=Sceloporus undulatus TaxID=8520 RepID=UPI001C4BFC28|nr:cathelicidin-2-like [Sceloporus undulatus]
MGRFLVGTMLLVAAFGVSGASSPVLDVASMLTPLEAARMAVEDYNEGTVVPDVFRLLKLRNTRKTRFGWGVHFSMNFTVKETLCQKTSSYRMGDCKYKPKGAIKDCSAEVSILNFMQDSPLTSMKCRRANSGGRKTKSSHEPQMMEASAPRAQADYFPSSYSTAALKAIAEK